MDQLVVEVLILFYCTVTGFVAAGLLGSLYQLITSKPPQFKLQSEGVLALATGTLLFFFAGPFILMRNALRGRLIERRPVGWLAASAFIAAMWSSLSGMFVLSLAMTAA